MRPTVLIDGDPIVYRCGFAAQRTVIHAIAEGPDGAPEPWRFEGKADRNQWQKEHPDYELVEETEELIVEPLPFVLQTVKQCLAPMEVMGERNVFLTGSGNFREKIATVIPYKYNRREMKRPVHYQAIRDYLVERWGAWVIDGREADDEISIRAAEHRAMEAPYVVASIDKDLDQIPGHHYDYAKHVEYDVSEEEAQKWFWRQVLSGDATDSVPGCWRIGEGKAQRLVDEWYLEGYSQENIWHAICQEYFTSQGKTGCPYKDVEDPFDIALETARLVYMQQLRGELWNPPGMQHGRIEGDNDSDA